jgi:hypothetical protein
MSLNSRAGTHGLSGLRFNERRMNDWVAYRGNRFRLGTRLALIRLLHMPSKPKPITPPQPQPIEPSERPVRDPQPYKDPVEPPPGDPNEDRPLHDPVPPNTDKPRM